MIENIMILDTETTGLSPKTGAQVIEIGAILFNVRYKSILQCFSTLLPCETNPVEHINHINPNATKCSYPFVDENNDIVPRIEHTLPGFQCGDTVIYQKLINHNCILIEMSNYAEILVAHNADFDKRFIETLRCGDHLLRKKWMCTKKDFNWPVPLTRTRLEDICNAMGVPYLNAHRALTDCLFLAKCFEKIEDLQERFNA